MDLIPFLTRRCVPWRDQRTTVRQRADRKQWRGPNLRGEDERAMVAQLVGLDVASDGVPLALFAVWYGGFRLQRSRTTSPVGHPNLAPPLPDSCAYGTKAGRVSQLDRNQSAGFIGQIDPSRRVNW